MPTLAERQAASSQFSGVELVATTGTFYPIGTLEQAEKDTRFQLALETIGRYAAAGVPVVAVDSSHLKGFTNVARELETAGAIIVPATQGGIARQRRQGAEYVVRHGAGKLLSAEPEKTLMADFAPEIKEALRTNDAISIGRTEHAQHSLPPVQERTEKLGGWAFEKLLQLPPDPWSGGRAFTADGAQSLIIYPAGRPGMDNWIWLYDTMLSVRGRGMSIGGIAVDLIHPASMVAEETGNPVFDGKRYGQFALQIDWAIKQPEVNTTEHGEVVAAELSATLHNLPESPANARYEEALSRLEQALAPYGYETPNHG